MAPWYTAIAEAIYREYDRRIRRASLITDYGTHHGDPHHEHGDEEHDDGSVIANLPRGADVRSTGADASHAREETGSALPLATLADAATAESPEEPPSPLPIGDSVALPELPPAAPAPAAGRNAPHEDDGEAEILNVPPGR
jgi:hypothetical protein